MYVLPAVIADRFELGAQIGRGGMGVVHRAVDRFTGWPVAIKLLASDDPDRGERFDAEASVLASLSHPRIVRYLAHGRTTAGARYLVMEWLDGIDLAAYLRAQRPTQSEAWALVRDMAAALTVAHQQGVVHRDLKPANVFLVDGLLARAKLLDFGIARGGGAPRTGAGVAVGSPGYMAPEQARGEPDLDARVDVYALGILLLECVTGDRDPRGWIDTAPVDDGALGSSRTAPTGGMRGAARPGLPGEIASLLAELLAPARAARPADAGQVLRRMGAIALDDAARPAQARTLSSAETGVAAVVLGLDPLTLGPRAARLAAVQAIADVHGGRLVVEGRAGNFAVVLEGSDAPTELAVRAASVALALRALDPPPQLGVLLHRLEPGAALHSTADLALALWPLGTPTTPEVRVSRAVAALLGDRFEVADAGSVAQLVRPRAFGRPRRLLDRTSPFVGRGRELGALRGLYEYARDSRAATSAIVVGPPGSGKSRLLVELVERLAADGAAVWAGRADPLHAGTPFAPFAAAARTALELDERAPDEARAWLGAHLVGVPGLDPGGAELIAEVLGLGEAAAAAGARDPSSFSSRVHAAVAAWLRAECAAVPLVIVLEDLHWADRPTLDLVDAVLEQLDEGACLVVASARPEIEDLFPGAWAARGVQLVHLGALRATEAGQLVRAFLPGLEAERVAGLVARGAGNPFFLEELIRAVAGGDDAMLPEGVASLIDARLRRLPAPARRVLRAAATLGDPFGPSGLTELLGDDDRSADLVAWLELLVGADVIEPVFDPHRRRGIEYRFHHALLGEAAYASMTDDDRRTAHHLAAAWLERTAPRDAAAIAEHFERAGERGRAVPHLLRAAHQAFDANQLDRALVACERGLEVASDDELRGRLEALRGAIHKWRGEAASARDALARAIPLLPAASVEWYQAVGDQASVGQKLGQPELVHASAARLRELWHGAGDSDDWVAAHAHTATFAYLVGAVAEGDALVDRAGEIATRGPRAGAQLATGRSFQRYFRGQLAHREFEHASALSRQAGDERAAAVQAANAASVYHGLGQDARAEALAREVIAAGERRGLGQLAFVGRRCLGEALTGQGRSTEAIELLAGCVADAAARAAPGDEADARTSLAVAQLGGGLPDLAEREARAAEALVPDEGTPARLAAQAVLAAAVMAQGRAAEAFAITDAATRGAGDALVWFDGTSLRLLTSAQALLALGRADEARVAAQVAVDRLAALVDRLGDDDERATYLQHIAEHAATLALAARLGGDTHRLARWIE